MIPPLLLEKAKAKGTDKEFQEYVRQFPCVFTDYYTKKVNGVGKSIYAHYNPVNRVSGMGLKAEYSGVPCLEEVHSVLLHGKGETPNLKEFLEKETIKYLTWFVNNKRPVDYETFKARKSRTYEIDCPELLDAIVIGLNRFWVDGKKRLMRIKVERATKKRTTQQNAAQWYLYQQMEKKCLDDPRIMGKMAVDYASVLVKRIFAQKDATAAIHEMMKTICLDGKSTTSLDIEDWGEEYAHDIIHYNREKLGNNDIVMPVNNEGY